MSGDCSSQPDSTVPVPGLDFLPGEVAGCYRLSIDPRGPRGQPRYTAIACSLTVRPYAVVTADPAELLRALGCDAAAAALAPARRAVS